ncbi:MAG: 1-acyl-sn-glycerol-3-phosphate acyltransferase [Bacteroidales bacterium]|nr:1-acyl-sn-glycerol-3-phosphate acyltransferase [Bacteroidales bacterium]
MSFTNEDFHITTERFIDIENVIRNKNPKLLKLLPRFILKYLINILHEDELNKAIYGNRDKTGTDFTDAMLNEFQVIMKIQGLKNIPETGKYIIASNHPLGGLDGMALMSAVGKVRKDIKFPVNDLLMHIPNLRPLFIPLNKLGKNTEYVEQIEQTFASDNVILYFPAGLCSRKQNGIIMDLEWKPTFIKKAIQYKRDILPAHIDGKNSNFFYNLSNWRKKAGIRQNIEMIYLVNEMYKQKNKIINIIFGKPISYETFDKKFNNLQWAEIIKKQVYELAVKQELPLQ